MSSSALATMGAGAIFGAALAASGVWSPYIVTSQMHFQDFHMLQAFLTATATSTVVMLVARRFSISECKPRSPSTLNWFSPHDGNIIGGLLLGFGMTLTGACPGTVLVQVAAGVRSGYLAFAGGLFGAFVYSAVAPYLQGTSKAESAPVSEIAELKVEGAKNPLTVYAKFQTKEPQAVLAFEALALLVVGSAALLTPSRPDVLFHPVVGGILIGGAQFASLILTGEAVGVSAGYAGLVQLAKHFVSPKGDELTRVGSVYFGAGLLVGSFLLSQATSMTEPGGYVAIPTGRALLGGSLMVFGARVAGGCTSGHGISGLSTLSTSSFITVASTFSGGMGLATLV